jgi:hypothetical protein
MLEAIIISVVGAILGIIAKNISQKVTNYITERERRELKKEAQQELHFLKLDAVIYALANVGEHKREFELIYKQRLREQLNEREDLEELIKQKL